MSVNIGSKFTGRPQAHIDTTSGTYWEVLPKLEGDAARIQRGLLKPKKEPSRAPLGRFGRYATIQLTY